MPELIEQELDYPDGNYEGGLTVDEKEPELKWAVAGRSAVPELFNWVSRKATEDIQRVIEYLSEYESVRKLTPLSELVPVAGQEPDIIYVKEYAPVFSFSSLSTNVISGSTQVKRPFVTTSVYWSMPDVDSAENNPTIDLDLDVTRAGDKPGMNIDSSSQELSIPSEDNKIQRTDFDFSLGIGDVDEDGWDDIRGAQLEIFLRRAPESYESTRLQVHTVEVS